MSGDYSRVRFDPRSDIAGVLMQQGRVQLDSDWNESVAMMDRRLRAESVDTFGVQPTPGFTGVAVISPQTPDAFKIEAAGGNITIGRGRMYVDGLLAENHGGGTLEFDSVLAELRGVNPLSYNQQPYFSAPPALPGGGPHLAYLEVWQREVTHLQQPNLVESAVGVDTTTRWQTVWQVRLLANIDSANCTTPEDQFPAWQNLIRPSGGRMSIRAEGVPPNQDPCELPPIGGYRGLENQLYRIEIHDGGGVGAATFKWSRDNASVASSVQEIVSHTVSGTELKLASLGRDAVLRFNTGDWVEILDDRRELSGENGDPLLRRGVMRKITVDDAKQTISFTPPLPADLIPADGNDTLAARNTRVKRWDQEGTVRDVNGNVIVNLDAVDSAGLIPVPAAGVWVVLENGVQVQFSLNPVGSAFRCGDYWVSAARSADTSVETYAAMPPRGIHHHYCRLAVVTFPDTETDCRVLWPPAPGEGCCIRVEPGDDLQEAINKLIEAGGGCLCLAKGVHEVNGPLLLHGARDISIYGENDSTILRLRGIDNEGLGGVALSNSSNITLEGLCIVGEAVPALIWTLAGVFSHFNRSITLRNLTLLNATSSTGEVLTNCAVRLADAGTITIEDCRLIAEAGIVALFGHHLPLPVQLAGYPRDYGDGVSSVSMRKVAIRYQSWGIWSLRSDSWGVEGCDIRPVQAEGMADLRTFLEQNPSPEHLGIELHIHLRNVTADTVDTSVGTAIRAFLWRDCSLSECCLYGARGLDVWCWLRGTASGNRVSAKERGFHAGWLHDAQCDQNRIECPDGTALSFVGSYRARLERNHVRALQGLTNPPWSEEIPAFVDYAKEVASIYPSVAVDGGAEMAEYLAFWMLVQEMVALMKLGGVVGKLLKVLAILFEYDSDNLDPLYFVLTSWIYEYMKAYDQESESSLPVIALDVRGNDFECQENCLILEQFFPLGGMGVAQNRLHAATGSTLRINAHPFTVNVHLLNFLWREMFKMTIENYIPNWISAIQGSEALAQHQKEIIVDFLNSLREIMEKWRDESESFLEADYRVEGNSLRSLHTAIESNIFELAILRNHITLRELAITNSDTVSVMDAFFEATTTAPLAVAMRDGSRPAVSRAARLMADEGLLRDVKMRTNAADAVLKASTGISDSTMEKASIDFAAAINSGDRTAVMANLPAFVAALEGYVDSYGIWVRGAGCRIVGNHVLVPADVDPDTWARGGIVVMTEDGEEEEDSLNSLILSLLLQFVISPEQLDPLLGITETLIDNNEVIGGVGHGVYVNAPIEYKQIDFGLLDIKIRGNQVRGMAGAGISIDEETLAVGVEIRGNQISVCSNHPSLESLTEVKGGVVAANVGLCRLLENRISRCGNELGGFRAFGVDLEGVYGAFLTDNQLLHNGPVEGASDDMLIGGCGMMDVFGEVGLHDNEILFNRGWWGLFFFNQEVDPPDLPFPASLLTLLNWYIEGQTQGGLVDAEALRALVTVEGNKFELLPGYCWLYGLDEVNFSGNQMNSRENAFVWVQKAQKGVFANNLLSSGGDPLWPRLIAETDEIATYVFAGNVCNGRILVITPQNAEVLHGLNVPEVLHLLIGA
jgi:hypothetical protein